MNTTPKQSESIPDSLRYWHSQTELLQTLLQSLKLSLKDASLEPDRWRKLAHVRFVTSMSQQFLDRLFATEESDHQRELESHPEFQKRVAGLRQDHTVIRRELSRILLKLDHTCATSESDCNQVFSDLKELVELIVSHTHREIAALQESVDRDLGGEG